MSDNEMDDIWERIDVGGDLAKIERCRNARRKGVGGGHGGAAASLSNTLQNLSKGAGAAGAGAPPAVAGVLRESEVKTNPSLNQMTLLSSSIFSNLAPSLALSSGSAVL
jgi:hypothetical protein